MVVVETRNQIAALNRRVRRLEEALTALLDNKEKEARSVLEQSEKEQRRPSCQKCGAILLLGVCTRCVAREARERM